MARKGKKYSESVQKVNKLNRYTFEEAIGLAVECANARFDESVELAVRLGVGSQACRSNDQRYCCPAKRRGEKGQCCRFCKR